MPSDPPLSILIPWCNRPELEYALSQNRHWFLQTEAEVLIINCAGDHQVAARIASSARLPRLKLVRVPCPRFNKALSLNLGIQLSKSEIIFTMDADIVADAFPVRVEADQLKSAFATVRWMHESKPEDPVLKPMRADGEAYVHAVDQSHSLTFYWSDGTASTVTTARKSLVNGSRAGAGQLLARKEHLIAVGGYNSALEHWGWEDNDMQLRLAKHLGLRHIESGDVTHLSHDDGSRAMYGETRATLTWHNLRQSVEQYSLNNFLGTFGSDVAQWSQLCEVEEALSPQQSALSP
jgi:hypothetical protein